MVEEERRAMASKEESERSVSPGGRPVKYDGSQGWASRILTTTLAAGAFGAGVGLILATLKNQAKLKYAGAMSANLAIATSCFCAAQELVRELRAGDPKDLVNCFLGGLGSGAILGRLQEPRRVLPCAILFASVGSGLQYGAIKWREYRLHHLLESLALQESPESESQRPQLIYASELTDAQKKTEWEWPEWFPIKRLDEETATKRAKARELHMQQMIEGLQNGGASNETG